MSSPSKPTSVQIEDLPPELIRELFKQLHPTDLVACSAVNKRWHSIYSNFKLNRLAAVWKYRGTVRKWYNTNQRIRDEELLELTKFTCLPEKPLFSHLKYLALCGESPGLTWLNKLGQLVHLEIDIKCLDSKAVDLNLPKLKVLVFHFFNEQCPLSIDCSELCVLVYRGEPDDQSLLNVKHPETIRKLETNMVSPKWLAPFKSVEYLVTQEIEAINKSTLQSLPRLKELRFNTSIEFLFRGSGTESLVGIKRMLIEFLDDVQLFGRPDFKFRFSGFHLPNKTKLNEIDFGVQVFQSIELVSNEYVYLKNYQLIEPDGLDFIRSINYNKLMRYVTVEEFPRYFSEKFTGILQVESFGKIQDADHFFAFLKSLDSLAILSVNGPKLGQEFYDQLPAVRSLVMFRLKEDDGTNLNFDFLGKFSHLSQVNFTSVSQNLSLQSTLSLVRWLGKLRQVSFYFQFEEVRFIIEKTMGSKVCKVHKNYRKELETENPKEILNFFKGLSREPLTDGPETKRQRIES